MRSFVAALLLSTGVAGQAFAATDDGVGIDTVRAHLFYERSGQLSEDLLSRDPPFVGWNTVIGEGDALEPAENLLIVAALANPGDEAYLSEKLTILVLDGAGGELKKRVFDGLLLPGKALLHLPMWLDNAGCIGAITIRVKFRKHVLNKALQLECGE